MRHKSVPPPLTRRSMDTPVHLGTANKRGNHAAQECAASAHPQEDGHSCPSKDSEHLSNHAAQECAASAHPQEHGHSCPSKDSEHPSNHAAQECAASAHPQIGVTLTCCKRWPNSAGGGNSGSNDSNRLQA